MSKEHCDMSGLGYNSNKSTTYSTKNAFVKKKKRHIPYLKLPNNNPTLILERLSLPPKKRVQKIS